MTTDRAAVSATEQTYSRSFLALRAAVGFLGIALPLLLVAGDGLMLAGEVPRSSLSAYYHTDMRDVFVGVLCAIAFFLVAYRIFDLRSLDNLLSALAGAAAVGVALFPTGAGTAGEVHQWCAVAFVACLALLSFRFGRDEGSGHNCPGRERPRRAWLHLLCAAIIVLAVVYMLANAYLVTLSPHAVFWGETAATWAFGVSWLAAGELTVLFRQPAPKPGPAPGPALESTPEPAPAM
jgi:hypothetical protein